MKFATAINCIDGRVQTPVINYIKNKYGHCYIDMITEPGPNKILSENTDHSTIESIKNKVKISIQKHNSNLLAVTGHYDCAGNPVEESEHKIQIGNAIKRLKTWNLKIKIIGLWINKNWRVEELNE